MTPLERAWYRDAPWLTALAPLESLYRLVVARRREAFRSGRRDVWQAPVPLVVVGNLSVGGTGKSPLVAWLARWLSAHGWHPGIVSRGYGGKAPRYPLRVEATTPAAHSGDEPLMLAQQTGVPVAVDPDRPGAARLLIEQGCDVLLADDGLQHYALGRSLELVVIDGRRGLGNRHCLPRGPLREPVSRLGEADALIGNGGFGDLREHDGPSVPRFAMRVVPRAWRHLRSGRVYPIDAGESAGPGNLARPFTTDAPVTAVAGIGHPERFFSTLETLGVEYRSLAFGDHHRFRQEDLPAAPTVVVMTAKDAVKCASWAHEQCWVLDVEAAPEAAFETWWQARTCEWKTWRETPSLAPAGGCGDDRVERDAE